jgi:cation:H+ antiporter
MLVSIVVFFVGLIILYYGAEFLVEGSSRLAMSFGVRPLIIGMTVVSVATSMPELMVSLLAVGQGSSAIAVGNIVGSNIANIGLILGVSALLLPLQVPRGLIKRELPFMIAVTVVLYLMCLDGQLGAVDASILLLLLVLFIAYCVRYARHIGEDIKILEEPIACERCKRGKDVFLIIGGVIGLGFGAHWMVSSAVTIARVLGMSELLIGMTIVALGTSLPELAASLVSAAKGQMDISIGNVIGSNIFNILLVLGVCPLFRPIDIDPAILSYELPLVLLFSFALVPLCWHRFELGRAKGAFLLLAYIGFISVLFIR